MKIFRLIKITLFCLAVSTGASAQNVLTGVVKDKRTGEGMVGGSVYVLNQDNRSIAGTVANMDGEYKLQIPAEKNLTVVFSMIGYKTQKIKYTAQAVINISLEEDAFTLDDIVVSARAVDKSREGLTKREEVSATQKLSMPSLLEVAPVTTIEDALQGRLANVDILTGAEPGSSSSIRIRGTSSLNASNEPLIVVDGVPYNTSISDDFSFATANTEDFGALVNIPPNDIESIEVLKDAAATALWGSKGANGVLLINTKKGRSGKTMFSVDLKYGYQKERNTIPMLNASQYIAMIQDAMWNSINDLGYSSSDSKTLMNYLFNTKEIGYDPNWLYFNEYNQETNWLKEITQATNSYEANFSMSGGGEKATYRLSTGYTTENGTTKGTDFHRINTSLNVRYIFSKKLDITTDFTFADSERNANWSNPRGQALSKMPNMSPYYIDANGQRTGEYFTPLSYFQGTIDKDKLAKGSLSGTFNPLAVINEALNKTSATESRFVFNLHYNLIPGLDFYEIIGLNLRKNKNKSFLPQSVTGVSWTDEWFNRSGDKISDNMFLNTDSRLNYNKYLGEDHKIVANISLQTNHAVNSSFSEEVYGVPSTSTFDPTAGGKITKLDSGNSESRSVGLNGNLHYGYKERYMFNVGYRSEANSAMGANNRWANFPTAGLAWIVSEENFLKEIPWLSMLKLRYSWGQSGNAPSKSYSYIGTFKAITPGYIDMPAIEPNQIQLDNLKWETVTSSNFGLDLSFLKDQVRIVADIYNRKTSDLLQADVSLPSTTGYSKINYFNSGGMRNKGWEFRIDWDIFKTKDWSLAMNFNVAQNENQVTEIPSNMTDYRYDFKNGTYAYKVKAGDPLGSFYGYKCLGVYQNLEDTYAKDSNGEIIKDINGSPVIMTNGSDRVYPGDAKYRDMNGDGVIDQYDIVYLGNSNPRFTGGGGFDLKYKDLMLSVFFHGRQGQSVINAARIGTENMHGTNNQSTAVLSRWRNEGDDTNIPRALYNKGYNYLGSDRFVEDASYLRLKRVTLRYALSKKIMKQLGINRLYLYCTAYDLFTWTKYTGQDPEVNLSKDGDYDDSIYMVAKDGAATPKAMRLAFGFSLNF